jgi:tetratricopeptide (TPR) repeat protein
MHYSISSTGRRTSSVGIPGTGLSYVKTSYVSKSRSAKSKPPASKTRGTSLTVPTARTEPGLFAPGYEKEFAHAVDAYLAGDISKARAGFRAAAAKDLSNRMIADDLLAGVVELQSGKPADAIPYLEKVVAAKTSLPDELLQKYLAQSPGLELSITPLVKANVPWSSTLAALALTEAYQAVGRIDEAIGVVQQLHAKQPEPALALSLCELLLQQNAWSDVNELAASMTNQDDVSLQIKLFQAQALAAQGLSDAAISIYNECLRSKKRDPSLIKAARYERGRQLLGLGRRKQAARDLGIVYAEDPGYADVATLVGAATAPETLSAAPTSGD